MDSGSKMESSKAASSGDGAMTTSPESESAAAAAGGGGEEEAAVSPPAPAAAASPRPYYECVFCKRGFTTAQALGGHMNIHRRDRAKPPARDSPTGITSVSHNVECYNKYRHLVSPPYYPPAQSSTPIPVGAGSSFAMYYVSSGTAAAGARLDAEGGSPSSVSPRELSLFGEANRDQDLHLGLGHQGHIGGGSRTPDEGGPERQQYSGEPERELDLELRLGRRPRH